MQYSILERYNKKSLLYVVVKATKYNNNHIE